MSGPRFKSSGKRAADFCKSCQGGGSQAIFIKGLCVDCYVESIGYKLIQTKVLDDKEKRKANQIVNKAVKEGRLKKPLSCKKCKKVNKIVGHHDDYSRPLDVTWVCESCHMKIHYKPLLNKDQLFILSSTIKEFRRASMITKAQLSRELDVSYTTVSRIENRGCPSLVTLLKLYDFSKNVPNDALCRVGVLVRDNFLAL